MYEFDYNLCRRGTKEALYMVVERFSSQHGKTVSIVMPTRYGKTHTGRLISGISQMGWQTPEGIIIQPFASTNIWVTVNLMLQDQATHADHWQRYREQLRIQTSQVIRKMTYAPYKHLEIAPNNEHFVSVNIQKIDASFLDPWLHWIGHQNYPPIFHFDECHFYQSAKPWGYIVDEFLEAGANIIVYTATAQRADNGIIPGFNQVEIDSGETYRGVKSDEFIDQDGRDYVVIDQWLDHWTKYIPVPDVRVPFSEAWNNDYLSKVSTRWVDVDLAEIDRKTASELGVVKLSEVKADVLRRDAVIGKVVRSPHFIRKSVRLAYDALMSYRGHDARAAMIVFTVSDRDGGRDEHAQVIKRIIHEIAPSFQIDVATMNVDNAQDIIAAFPKNDHDVIAFKGMGGVGWDCDRANVVLDLGDDRQIASKIQAWMRGGTPWNDIRVFTLVVPEDALAKEIHRKCIDDEGGEMVETVSEYLSQTMKEKKLRDDRPLLIPGVATIGSISDQEARKFAGLYDPLVRFVKSVVPTASIQLTDAAIVEQACKWGVTVVKEHSIDDTIIDLTSIHDAIINDLDSAVRQVVMQYGLRDKNDVYGEISRQVYKDAFQRSSIPWVEVRRVQNVSQANELRKYAAIILEEAREKEYALS